MDINKILIDCDALENTISVLIKNNSLKEAEIARLQASVFENTKIHLEDMLEREVQLQSKLDEVVSKRQAFENEIKQYTAINEKLSELVSIAQKRGNQDNNEDTLVAVAEANEEYSHIKSGYIRASNKLRELEEGIQNDSNQVQTLVRENAEILVELQRNDNLGRLLEQQNKYAEQQFDLVLNQLPWEPLTQQNIEDLLKSPNQVVRDVTNVLQMQASEIEDLNESLRCKKKKKCDVLEELLSELSSFIQRRDEAVLIAKLSD